MTMDALRRELWEESIRQELIAAEIAEQRELEAEDQRNLGLSCEVPSRSPGTSRFQPLPHGRLRLEEQMAMRTGASVFRLPVKYRIEEWYCPPWHRTLAEENATFNGAKLRKKLSSGVKRKRSADTFQTNSKKLCVQRSCVVRQMNTRYEEHSSGHRHQPNIAVLESRKEAIGMKKVEAESLSVTRYCPTTWNCGICQANCSCEMDLRNHLRGRRHQENVEALKREDMEIEAKLDGKKLSQLAEKNQKFVPGWSRSTCKAICTSSSDLENHLRGRRHRRNVDM
ncbi:uncharacterized protein LOC102708918 [Oryza brachyantha]|uniref:C2H2-type domain-containing protein n=1 Tax=Oryza brachyantha TaxID=4533 RepID=J3MTE3_ORYBR|nr:uncharacterized protein LOC102708918 [Oryza brachyantha]